MEAHESSIVPSARRLATGVEYLIAVAIYARLSLAADTRPAPVALLAEPGFDRGFLMLADGSVRVSPDGPIVSEAVSINVGLEPHAEAPAAALSWYAPGSRVIRALRTGPGWEVETLSGAAGYGPPGRQSLWLLRRVRLANRSPRKADLRLMVTISRVRAALRDDVALVSADGVVALVSRPPTQLRQGESETVAAFDFQLGKSGVASLLLAVPNHPAPYEPTNMPDIRSQDPDSELDAISESWESRVLPNRLRLGSTCLTDTFHAAVGTLLLSRPASQQWALTASTLSALARVGRGTVMAREVEALVTGQDQGGRFSGVTDPRLQADLTTALADYALYSDPPERWTALLWRPIARAAGFLENTTNDPRTAPHIALALTRSADVAAAIESQPHAEQWRSRAHTLLVGCTLDDSARTIFEVRSRALFYQAVGTHPPPIPYGASLEHTLGAGYLNVLAGDRQASQQAWESVTKRLMEQPLPGVPVADATEDTHCAAVIVFLVADSIARGQAGDLHLLSAAPIQWVTEGEGLHLLEFPSGLGSLRLDATTHREGSVSISMPKGPGLADRLLVWPPLGITTRAVRANGKALSPDTFAAGPPWVFNTSVWSMVLLQGLRE